MVMLRQYSCQILVFIESILYSIDGHQIGTGISNHVTIPTVAPAGIYVVRYTENGQLRAKKIVIK